MLSCAYMAARFVFGLSPRTWIWDTEAFLLIWLLIQVKVIGDHMQLQTYMYNQKRRYHKCGACAPWIACACVHSNDSCYTRRART